MSRRIVNVTTGETTVVEWTAEELAGFQIQKAEEDVGRYRRDRVYPPIGDQLDALFRAGVSPPEMAAQLQAVKDAHPKSA